MNDIRYKNRPITCHVTLLIGQPCMIRAVLIGVVAMRCVNLKIFSSRNLKTCDEPVILQQKTFAKTIFFITIADGN